MAARDAVVVGVHTTAQVRGADRPGLSFALESLRGALAGAGLSIRDVEGLYASSDWPLVAGADGYYAQANWPYQLGIPVRWFTGAVNAAGTGAAAVLDAAAAIAAGQIDTAAIVVGRGANLAAPATGRTADFTRNSSAFTAWTGSYTTVQFALAAQRHMHAYGTTAEQLASVAATIRNHAHVNPGALMHGRGPYDAAAVLASRMVAEPLTLLMCAGVNDGGGALVITTRERARDLPARPVQVLGGGDQLCYPAYWEVPLLEHHLGGEFPRDWVDAGFARAGVTREDVDVVELYDGFASWVVMQWEMLGFCATGEGGPFAASGVMEVDGRLPTCTDGGCMGFSHNGTPSLLRVVEAVRQLRDDVPDACPGWERGEHTHERGRCRAANGPDVALAVSMGPPTGGGNFVLLGRG